MNQTDWEIALIESASPPPPTFEARMVAFEVERTKVGLDTLLLVTVRQPGPWVQGVTS
jgi:hypothetical protein